MDGHLAALSSTLGSIAQLQRQLLHEPKSHPFTNAVLAPMDPDPYMKPPKTFIRESDSVERRLFYFPPVGGMLDDPSANGQQHHQYRKGERDVEEEAADIASELLLRKPEVKSVPMPTPLRPTATARRAGGEAVRKEYDTRALLIAAQRLSENYNRQPRQRKHIRTLLKKTAELRDQTTVHTRQALRFEAVLARLTNGEDPHSIEELPALLNGAGPDGGEALEEQKRKQKRIQELKDKAQKVKEELNREEMEVLALEEMREEMLQKKRALQEKSAPSSSSSSAARKTSTADAKPSSRAIPRVVAAAQGTRARPAPRTSAGAAAATTTAAARKPVSSSTEVKKPAGTATTSSVRRPGSRPRLSAGPPASGTAATAASRKSSSPATPKASTATSGPRKSTERAAPTADADGDDDITVRLRPDEIAAATAAADSAAAESPLLGASADLGPGVDVDIDLDDNHNADPEPTDELERLTEKTWEIFGDNLRFFTSDPTMESADFRTTLGLLRRFLPHNAEADRPGSAEAAAVAAATRQGRDPEIASASGVSSDAPNVGTGTGASASSVSGSGGGGSAGNISAPTRTSRILALILLELLRAPEPDHSVDLANLKTLVKEWYSGAVAAGREAALEEGIETLASQAVYGMVAKRGFKLRRTGGKALVRFT